MLIQSERHRPEDLELWKELEEADKIHGEAFASSGKIKKSIEACEGAEGSHWVGVSWGKDSVCLAHIVYRSGKRWPLVYFKIPGHEPQETLFVRDAWMKRFPATEYHEIEVPKPDHVHHDRYNLKPSKQFGGDYARSQWGRWVNGLRADESCVRKIYLRTYGLADCEAATSPIGWWTTQEIFAYLHHYNLPTHSNYAMLGGGRWDRNHLRVSPLGGIMGDQFGRAEWEREYYGDVLNRLAAKKSAEKAKKKKIEH